MAKNILHSNSFALKRKEGGEKEEKWKERRSTSEERGEEKKASGLNGREKGGIGEGEKSFLRTTDFSVE